MKTKLPDPGLPALHAVARLPANARDMLGDTLGSFSALALEPETWRRTKGGFETGLVSLPDRGFNTPADDEYSDYPGRVHFFTLTILDGGEASLSYRRSSMLRDARGAFTTGLDPGKGVMRHLGAPAPAFETAKTRPRLCLDAEGLALRGDGSFYVSDEFSCSIYHCDPSGRMTGVIRPPKAIAPVKDGTPHFTSDDGDPPSTGRQPNDGFEGLCLSPDGRTLYALMQSPLMQDLSDGDEGQRFIRLVTYDVSGTPCPAKPSGHYVVELPLYRIGDKVKAPEANCVLAHEGGVFWILARDGGGFGDRKGKGGRPRPVHFKQVLQGRLDAVANLAGTRFDAGTKSAVRDGALAPGVTPIHLRTVLDVADEAQLNSKDLTTRAGAKGLTQIAAKWESLCLSPPLKSGGRERLLLIGNDNDFLTRDGFMPDRAYDAKIDNPNMILIYRVMTPEIGSPNIAAVSKT